MSYNTDLGRVKGDKGTTYIPKITLENGKQYISYESDDGTPIPSALQKKEFTSFIYKPSLDENGNLSFVLSSDLTAILNLGNIKGPVGESTIGIRVVDAEPEYNNLSDAEKTLITNGNSHIYVIDTDEAYLGAGVFKKDGSFKYLESKLRFDNYYLKTETYHKDDVYNKQEIATQLGSIIEQQNAITAMLGDTDAIIIPDDE